MLAPAACRPRLVHVLLCTASPAGVTCLIAVRHVRRLLEARRRRRSRDHVGSGVRRPLRLRLLPLARRVALLLLLLLLLLPCCCHPRLSLKDRRDNPEDP